MALVQATLMKEFPRKVVYIHTKIDGHSNFEIWIESADRTYFEKAPPSNSYAQDLRIAEWDLMQGRPNSLADELALFPLTTLDPQVLIKGGK